MWLLAIDPGGTTGWASFDRKGKPIAFDKIKGHDEFLDWLEEQKPERIVCESYKVRPGVNHSFSDVPTLQLIGAIKRWARKQGIEVKEQQPADMYIGLRHLGLYTTYKGKHVPDNISALAHGEYYLIKNKLKRHNLEKEH